MRFKLQEIFTSATIKEQTTATNGLPDFVLPCLTKFNKLPNRSSSARAFRILDEPIMQDNSPENVDAIIPMGTKGFQKLISCKTLVL
jgi:hypothetical protein